MKKSSAFESTKFYILLALAGGPSYGYAIQEQIVGDTLGLYLRETTIYSALSSLERIGLIERVNTGHGARHTYQLTDAGRRKLEHEARTWHEVAKLAQQRLGYH